MKDKEMMTMGWTRLRGSEGKKKFVRRVLGAPILCEALYGPNLELEVG